MNSNKTASFIIGAVLIVAVFGYIHYSAPPEKPPMPISITFRKATLDSSLVAQFHNDSNRYLAVLVQFDNKTLHQTKMDTLELPPLETKEIGWMEGWKFMSGEYVAVRHEDYADKSIRVP